MNPSLDSESIPAAPAIIPVIDLMIGQVVLAQNGDREFYQPVHTKLINQSDPVAVARALFGQTGCDCLYIADLDSFEGAKPSWHIFKQLLKVGFQIWVDADWFSDSERLEILEAETQSQSVRPIISTEQLADESQFENLKFLCDKQVEPIFSVDLRQGELLCKCEQLGSNGARTLVRQAYESGVRSLIWLDVASVGTASGVGSLIETIKELNSEFPDMVITSGGGVRNPDDASKLLSAGCQHVLVATAIHDCKFRPDDVTKLDTLRSGVLSQKS